MPEKALELMVDLAAEFETLKERFTHLEAVQRSVADREICVSVREKLATALEERLDAQEVSLTKRETALESVRNDLSMARTAKVAALEREAKLAEKLEVCRKELGAAKAQLTKIEQAFPGLLKTKNETAAASL